MPTTWVSSREKIFHADAGAAADAEMAAARPSLMKGERFGVPGRIKRISPQ